MEYQFIESNSTASNSRKIRSHAGKVSRQRRREAQKPNDVNTSNSTRSMPSAVDAWRRHRTNIRINRPPKFNDSQVFALMQAIEETSVAIPDADQLEASEQNHGLVRLCPPIDDSDILRKAHSAFFVYDCFGRGPSVSNRMEARLEDWTHPSLRTMEVAAHAISFLCVQSRMKSEVLTIEARKSHVVAVSALRRELESPNPDLIAILGAASILLSCESYNLVSSGPEAMDTHLTGIMTALVANPVPHTPGLHTFVLKKFRHMSLMKSLVARRAFNDEIALRFHLATYSPSRLESFMQLAVRLPELLEKAATLQCSAHCSCGAENGVTQRLLDLECELIGWLDELNEHELKRASPLEELDTGATLSRPEVFQVKSKPAITTSALHFPSLISAIYHAFCWTCLLLIRTRLHEAATKHQSVPRRDYSRDSETTADLLCASLPFLTENAGGAFNVATCVRAPLHFSSEWYKATHNDIKLKWCCETESEWRERLSFLQWDTLLPQSFIALCWFA